MNGFVIILIVLAVGIFVLAEIYDSLVMDEFDPVCEERCKNASTIQCAWNMDATTSARTTAQRKTWQRK